MAVHKIHQTANIKFFKLENTQMLRRWWGEKRRL